MKEITGNTKKTGILGGTFNPIHNGHIKLAKTAAKEFDLDKVLLMPNNIPAYKSNENIISGSHRAAMVSLAVKDFPNMEMSDIELNRNGITYTADTLTFLTDKYPDTSWYFIMGGDSLMTFDKWHNPEKILALSKIIVTVRDNISKKQIEDKVLALKKIYSNADISIMDFTPLDVSSSQIRYNISHGTDVKGMIPDDVINYISLNRLYQEE